VCVCVFCLFVRSWSEIRTEAKNRKPARQGLFHSGLPRSLNPPPTPTARMSSLTRPSFSHYQCKPKIEGKKERRIKKKRGKQKRRRRRTQRPLPPSRANAISVSLQPSYSLSTPPPPTTLPVKTLYFVWDWYFSTLSRVTSSKKKPPFFGSTYSERRSLRASMRIWLANSRRIISWSVFFFRVLLLVVCSGCHSQSIYN